jgi:hypothetical protein
VDSDDYIHSMNSEFRDDLVAQFSHREVTLAEDLLRCADAPPTSDKFRRMLLLLLRGHYSSPENYVAPFEHLRCYVWDDDPKKSSLTIDFTHAGDDQKPDRSPGIFVGFGPSTFSRVAIGDFLGQTQDAAGTMTGKLATVTFAVTHVNKNPHDASDMAEMTARLFQALAHLMFLHAGAMAMDVISVKEPEEKNPSPKDQYKVAVSVQVQYNHGVTRFLESHRLRRIVQRVSAITP